MKHDLSDKKSLYHLLIIILLSFGAQSMVAQMTVTGTITDSNGPLPGVNVVEKGTTNGSVADFDGNYSITVSQDSATLVFTYVGYTTQEVPVDGRSTINVTMSESAQELSEVVVVGYGTQRKADLNRGRFLFKCRIYRIKAYNESRSSSGGHDIGRKHHQ